MSPPASAESARSPERELLIFEIGASRFGLPSADVREVLRAVTIVPLPGAPPIVEGLINVRGRIVPVLDIRRRFR
jgi:purine-binding chemotaxis protein CheW